MACMLHLHALGTIPHESRTSFSIFGYSISKRTLIGSSLYCLIQYLLVLALHSNLPTHMTRTSCRRSTWDPHSDSLESLHRHSHGISNPLIQIIKTSEDVSYAASSLSGTEILGVYPNLALRHANSPELCRKMFGCSSYRWLTCD